MSSRYHRKMAILHKIETIYGTDAGPAAADALIASNVTFTPMEGEEVSRDLMLPYLGNQGVKLAGIYARIEFDIEAAGAGAAGDIPKYGSVLRICGMSETISAATSVTYAIVEDDVEAGSLYFVSDKVQHVMLGCRGNVSVSFTPKGIPKFRFTVLGLLGTITDIGAMPAVSKTGWTDPLIVSKAATVMSLHGWTATAESLSIDLGNKVEPRFLIGEENMLIADRGVTGTAVVTAKSLATINWFDIAQSRARGALSLVHGVAAGNIVEVASPTVEIGRPTQGETQGISNYSLPLSLCSDVGLDELELIIR
jgi:Phage tail tube protein